jgi:hypothetical protein
MSNKPCHFSISRGQLAFLIKVLRKYEAPVRERIRKDCLLRDFLSIDVIKPEPKDAKVRLHKKVIYWKPLLYHIICEKGRPQTALLLGIPEKLVDFFMMGEAVPVEKTQITLLHKYSEMTGKTVEEILGNEAT